MTSDEWKTWFADLTPDEQAVAIADMGEQVDCLSDVRRYVLEGLDCVVSTTIIRDLAFGERAA